ncbi:MAG: lipoate--protein ligase family protein [Planctomycetales bacterium]|nr:lipoate--protein ligase family protein [Planctomycetales bacterium]
MSLRVLLSPAAGPAWNLALDEALWRLADGRPVLRVYAWDPSALSLGYFQPWRETLAAIPLPPGTPVVRRATGGGAIYHHAGEATYSVVARIGRGGLPRGVRASYAVLHGAVARALAPFGVAAAERGTPGDGDAALCFARAEPVDLVAAGRKICGSAQRRRGEALLQQGTILLEPNPLVPEAISAREAAGRPVSRDSLAEALSAEMAALLGGPVRRADPTEAERALADRLVRERYGVDSWIRRR